MTVDEAIDFIEEVLRNRVGSLAGWKYSFGGMIGQIRRHESSSKVLLKFLGSAALRRTYAWKGGLLSRAYGTKDGMPAAAIRRTPVSGPNTYLVKDMASVTGTACAAFMVLALEQSGERIGAFAPEDWAEPKAFYDALVSVGTPRHEIVERA
jgi:hypothetical protein